MSTVRTAQDLVATPKVALTHIEVATLLGIDPRTVISAIESGDLPGSRLGRKYMVPKAAFMAQFQIDPSAA